MTKFAEIAYLFADPSILPINHILPEMSGAVIFGLGVFNRVSYRAINFKSVQDIFRAKDGTGG